MPLKIAKVGLWKEGQMIGKIEVYSSAVNAGYIRGDDGNLYAFHKKEWLDKNPPEKDQPVRFGVQKNGQASQIEAA